MSEPKAERTGHTPGRAGLARPWRPSEPELPPDSKEADAPSDDHQMAGWLMREAAYCGEIQSI